MFPTKEKNCTMECSNCYNSGLSEECGSTCLSPNIWEPGQGRLMIDTSLGEALSQKTKT